MIMLSGLRVVNYQKDKNKELKIDERQHNNKEFNKRANT